MDDSLEIPTAHAPTTPLGDVPPEDEDECSSDEEDGGLDWTKLLQVTNYLFNSLDLNCFLFDPVLLLRVLLSQDEVRKSSNRVRVVARISNCMFLIARDRPCLKLFGQQERFPGKLAFEKILVAWIC